MVKRLSSSQLCSNFKNWKDAKNVSKELYEATLQEIKLRSLRLLLKVILRKAKLLIVSFQIVHQLEESIIVLEQLFHLKENILENLKTINSTDMVNITI